MLALVGFGNIFRGPLTYSINIHECWLDLCATTGSTHLISICFQKIMEKADQNQNLEMDFAEFAQYMQDHETKLKLAFSHLDRNKDGMISNVNLNFIVRLSAWTSIFFSK